MDATVKDILRGIEKYGIEDKIGNEPVVMGNANRPGWISRKIRYIEQIIIVAHLYDTTTSGPEPKQFFREQLEKELTAINPYPIVHPYPYDDLDQMQKVLPDLLINLGSPLTSEDIIPAAEFKKHPSEHCKGIVLVGIIKIPRLV